MDREDLLLVLERFEGHLLAQSQLCRNRHEDDVAAGRMLQALAHTVTSLRYDLQREWEPRRIWWNPLTWLR